MDSIQERTAAHIDELIAQYFRERSRCIMLNQTLGQFLEEMMFSLASDPVLEHFRKRAESPDGYEGMDGL